MTHSSPQGSTPNSSKQDELLTKIFKYDAHKYGTSNQNNLDNFIADLIKFATTLAEETSIRAKQEVLKDLLDWYEMYNKPGFNWYGAVKAMQVMKDPRKPFVELAPQKESE